MIKVMLWAPARTPLGGHLVQLEKTAEALNLLEGVRSHVSHDARATFDGVDLVHGFFLELEQVRAARTARLPVVLSPIYWSKDYRQGKTQPRTSLQEVHWRARAAGVLGLAALRGTHHAKSESYVQMVNRASALYESVDLLLPNSAAEGAELVADLAVTTPCHVVPNAVDPTLFTDPGSAGRRGVLMVARMEPHKNQLGLIRALKGSGLHLTLAGAAHPDHPQYEVQCRAEADLDEVRFLGRVPDGDLPGVYARAMVHVLPSFFETTGLVSLEAALSGCAVVTTSRGYARDYFGDLAEYCDPSRLPDVLAAVRRAHTAGPHEGLAQHVRENFTWAHTAAATLAGYRKVC